jgi:chromosome segregation ATPase
MTSKSLKRGLLCAVIGAAGGLLLPLSSASADAISSARLAYDSASQRLTNAASDVDDAQRALNYASSDQQNALARLSNARSALDAMRSILDDPNLPQQATAEAQAASQAVAEKTAAVNASQKRLDAINSAANQIRSAARKVYESSPAFTDTAKALDDAQRRVDATMAIAEATLKNDPQYAQLRATADRLNQEVRVLRDQRNADQDQLTAASQRWIAAEGAASTFRQNWLDANRSVIDARAAVATAKQARDNLEERFNQDLTTDPNLATVNNDRAKEEQNLAVLTD